MMMTAAALPHASCHPPAERSCLTTTGELHLSKKVPARRLDVYNIIPDRSRKVCLNPFNFQHWNCRSLGTFFKKRWLKCYFENQQNSEASSVASEDVSMTAGSSSSLNLISSSAMTVAAEDTSKLSALTSEQHSLSSSFASETLKEDSGPFICLTILGATGELAKNKVFPALFALYYSGHLPKNFAVFGYSRSQLTDDDLRKMISEGLTCRIDHQKDCSEKMENFLQKVFYQSGGYDTCEGMLILDTRIRALEGDKIANRIFYLSVPQDVILEVASCVSSNAQSASGWSRVIIEKPFGYDAQSSASISKGLLSGFNENQIYRIDHLLGKELIENLTVLRFSNLIFEPLWSRTYIRNVQIIHSEECGVAGRARNFDQQGIIRDLVQSHILQTIALFAMETPVSLDGEDIRNEKVKLLRSMRIPTFHDVALGQYKASISKDGKSRIAGYLEEADVSPNSLTPTFMAAVLYIDNARWDGVPFLVKAGNGLIRHAVEIRIQFHDVPGNLYREKIGLNAHSASNELILRVQPDEAIFLKINNKVPGLGLLLDSSELNLLYRDRYELEIPDSYERLILDVIDGDNHLFIRSDELAATWDLLTPVLEEIETHRVVPELYTFGGRGPIGAYYLGAKHGVRWADD